MKIIGKFSLNILFKILFKFIYQSFFKDHTTTTNPVNQPRHIGMMEEASIEYSPNLIGEVLVLLELLSREYFSILVLNISTCKIVSYLNLIRVWYFYLLLPYERKKERDVCLHSTVLKYFQQKRNFISVLENIPHH